MSVANSVLHPPDIAGESPRVVGQEHRRPPEAPNKKKVRRPRIPKVGEKLTQSGTPPTKEWASCVPLGALESALRKAVVGTTTLRKPAE